MDPKFSTCSPVCGFPPGSFLIMNNLTFYKPSVESLDVRLHLQQQLVIIAYGTRHDNEAWHLRETCVAVTGIPYAMKHAFTRLWAALGNGYMVEIRKDLTPVKARCYGARSVTAYKNGGNGT